MVSCDTRISGSSGYCPDSQPAICSETQLELCFHHGPQSRAAGEFLELGSPHPLQCFAVSPTGSIATPTAVARDLTRHRRRRPPQPPRDHPQRVTRRDPTRDLLARCRRDVQPRPLRFDRLRPQNRADRTLDRMTRTRHLLPQPPQRCALRQQLSDPFPLTYRQPLHIRLLGFNDRTRRMLLSSPEPIGHSVLPDGRTVTN